jgi:unsaturated rhamnogalacturonyl hydrolase
MLRAIILILASAVPSLAQFVVALDGYHNNESKMPDHYQWDGARSGGFSEVAKLLRELGAELRTLRQPAGAETLKGVEMLIVVDPDTTTETENPKYIEAEEGAAIVKWVSQGGRLVLLGNDKGNAEFAHLNQLASRFGIEFLETTYPKVQGKGILIASGSHPIFENGLQVYMVEVAPLKITGGADVILADKGTDIMALAHSGKGLVFALGDPWIYNEYIGHKDNRRIATNLFRSLMKK